MLMKAFKNLAFSKLLIAKIILLATLYKSTAE